MMPCLDSDLKIDGAGGKRKEGICKLLVEGTSSAGTLRPYTVKTDL